jgi:hypothetical protein
MTIQNSASNVLLTETLSNLASISLKYLYELLNISSALVILEFSMLE